MEDLDRFVAGFLTAACAAAIVGLAVGPFWTIRDVSVLGAHHVTVDAAVVASALTEAPTFTSSAAAARARLLELPAVRDARVEIALPDRVRITLIERTPVARWVGPSGEWLIDRDGVVFGSLDPRAGPDLRITDERAARKPGERIDPALVDAALKLARLGPSELRADATSPRVFLTGGGNGLVLRFASGWEIRFGGAERIDEKIANARRYVRENQQRKIDYVDVRTPDSIVVSPR